MEKVSGGINGLARTSVLVGLGLLHLIAELRIEYVIGGNQPPNNLASRKIWQNLE